MSGYIEDISLIDNLLGLELNNVIHVISQLDEEKVLLFAILTFNNDSKIIFEVGSLGENISITSEQKMNEDIERMGLTPKFIDVTEDEEWMTFKNKKLDSYKLMDYKGYCHNSIIFCFEDGSMIEIYSSVNDLKFTFR